jgi:hypothetical protein
MTLATSHHPRGRRSLDPSKAVVSPSTLTPRFTSCLFPTSEHQSLLQSNTTSPVAVSTWIPRSATRSATKLHSSRTPVITHSSEPRSGSLVCAGHIERTFDTCSSAIVSPMGGKCSGSDLATTAQMHAEQAAQEAFVQARRRGCTMSASLLLCMLT